MPNYYIGLTYKPEDVSKDGTIVLRSGNIQDGQFDLSDIVRVKARIREKQFVRPGDILMCSRNGSARLVGKSTVIPEISEPMTFGAFMTIFRTPYNDYLQYFLQSNCFRRQLSSSKTTTINQITIGMLDSIEIDLPNYSEREARTDKLNVLQKIIQFRKQELLRLDELIKAQFVEMFGDPKINEKNWNKGVIADYFEVKGGKRIPKGMDYSVVVTNHPYLRATDMKNETILDDDIHYIGEDVFQHIKRYTVQGGDIYLTNVGVNLV